MALCAIAVLWPRRLLAAAILCSPFEGVALASPGGLGISPFSFALVLVAGRSLLVRTESQFFLGRTPRVRVIVGLALVLTSISLAGAVVLPRLFAGIPVMSPRLSVDAVAPLVGSASNLGQAAYLLVNVTLLWHVAQRRDAPEVARDAVAAFRIAGAIVVFFGLYQLASAWTGIPFPDDLLYSNEQFVMQHGTAILDMPRICSTFTEPAGMAVFLLGFLAFGIAAPTAPPVRFQHLRTAGRLILIALTVFILVMSTSSTAYIGLAGLTAWTLFRVLVLPCWTGRWSLTAIGFSVGAVAIVASAVMLDGTLHDAIEKTVFEKNDSDSYSERSDADQFAYQLDGSTWGLGVGLGSNRASGFLPSLLSTIGIYGTATFALLIFQALRPLPVKAEIGGDDASAKAALSMALLGIIGAKLISSPDFSTPSMWAALAGLLAVISATETSAKEAHATTAGLPPGSARRHRSIAPYIFDDPQGIPAGLIDAGFRSTRDSRGDPA